MTADGLVVLPCFLFTDSLVAIFSGIIRGVGKQRTGAIVSMACMYFIGGPVGLCLMMLTDLSVSDEEDESSLHERDIRVEACTPTTVCTRTAFIAFCVSTVAIALVGRFVLDWKSHFRRYCVLNNGTLFEINPSDADQSNRYCLQILP
ncbi:Protein DETOXIFICATION 9 [Taenia solium]|eukprot:TsM_000067300 transcript=TsM_000067300 gene=TsM_000067300